MPPPRILNDEELGSLMSACRRVSPGYPQRGSTLTVLVGLLASTGLRSGEALRLDRADVDLIDGVLHIRKTKFRKDRLVPIHSTTLAALHNYARDRDAAFPAPKNSGFFLSSRGSRLSPSGLKAAFVAACKLAGLNNDPDKGKALRPHDLRHRFAVPACSRIAAKVGPAMPDLRSFAPADRDITRLAVWHRENADVQALLPLLATYLGHARYSDTAYYVTATADLLDTAANRAFAGEGVS